MPHYFFDIKDGRGLADRAGSDCKNDAAAFEKARVLAIGVSLDKPAVDPTRRISVLNADRAEISSVAVYQSPPSNDSLHWRLQLPVSQPFVLADFIGATRSITV
jgi:hypothetical protein